MILHYILHRSGFVGVSGGRRRAHTGHSYNKEQFLQAK